MTRPAIVAAGPGDLERLAEIQATCFLEPWGARSLAKTLSLPGAFALLLRDTTPAGRISVGFAVAQIAADQADLLSFGVIPGQRRRGLGRRLLDGTLERAAKGGARSMFLEVAEDNIAAIALYCGNGFDIIGRRDGYYRDAAGRRIAAITMRRAI
jgi:ribosomal-protein-alanine N-acetyltransferase